MQETNKQITLSQYRKGVVYGAIGGIVIGMLVGMFFQKKTDLI